MIPTHKSCFFTTQSVAKLQKIPQTQKHSKSLKPTTVKNNQIIEYKQLFKSSLIMNIFR